MSISHFMDIQQKEKESLAAYVHCVNERLTDVNLIMMPPLSEFL